VPASTAGAGSSWPEQGADLSSIATTVLPEIDEIPVPRSLRGLWLEARVGADLARGLLHLPHTLRAPRGGGHPVLLLPGFAASDRSMAAMRLFLRRLGWRARGWGLGVNRGDAPALLPRVIEVIDRSAQRFGGPVRLVGWSMGGFLAREVARDRPDLIAQVVTMGTPVVGGPKYTSLANYFRRLGYDIDAIAAECASRATCAIAAPITAIYSRRDGVVAWQACIDRESPRVEHVEVESTHTGLGFDPRVWRIVADRLARMSQRSRRANHRRWRSRQSFHRRRRGGGARTRNPSG
jgi:pimeloyl-ACP methyl ester carboxylesterase